jgi:hypothetical protein
VADALGVEFKDIFVDHKRAEWDKAFFQVSAEQREAMLMYICGGGAGSAVRLRSPKYFSVGNILTCKRHCQ